MANYEFAFLDVSTEGMACGANVPSRSPLMMRPCNCHNHCHYLWQKIEETTFRNPTMYAKEIQEVYSEYFMNEGAVPWQFAQIDEDMHMNSNSTKKHVKM